MSKDLVNQAISKHSINLSKNELMLHGCINCVWRMHSQCPHNIDIGDKFGDGICEEFLGFLLSFAGPNGSASEMWEKFNVYLGRIQQLEDYKDYLASERQYKELKDKLEEENVDVKKNIYTHPLLQEYESQRNSLRLWWMKMNEMVGKELSKIVDREYKEKPKTVTHKIDGPGIHNSKPIEFNKKSNGEKKK